MSTLVYQEQGTLGVGVGEARALWREASGCVRNESPGGLSAQVSVTGAQPISLAKELSPGLNFYCGQLGQVDFQLSPASEIAPNTYFLLFLDPCESAGDAPLDASVSALKCFESSVAWDLPLDEAGDFAATYWA